MNERHNLFISFSADDNAKEGGSEGWVDNFIRYLTVYIQKINNQSPEISKLDENASRPSSLGQSDGLILIVSKNYIEKNISKKDGPLLNDPSRILKIDLEPIKKSAQAKEIRTLNEFHFFRSLSGSDKYSTLSANDDSQNFWLKIIDLAFEIDRVIYQKKARSTESSKKIYLAETSNDQIHNRDEIKRELIRHGHYVLPSTPFSSDIKEFEAQVKDCLKESDLSIHLIGESYGESPEGSDKSIVEIQNQLSTEYYANRSSGDVHSLHRLIWMPIYLKARSDQQKLYLDQLKDDISSTAGAEIIRTPLEILKTVIHSRLQVFDGELKARNQKDTQRSSKKVVYLLFDKKDEKEISPIVKNIESRNIDVILPQFDDKQIEFLESHRQSLVKSDGVLLFANNNLNWVNSKLNDVIKAPGFGKQYPFEAKAIYIKNSSIPKDKLSDFGDLQIFNGEGKNETTNIDPFLDKIAST